MKIFISYRRDDSSGYAGRLFDHLSQQFGRDNIFMDVDKIGVGADFVDTLEQAVASCHVLIALIGRRWLNAKNADGSRRLDDPGDFVRREVATALAGDGIVVPVLVDGAGMPSANELADELQPLQRRNAVELTNTRWDYDLDRLTEAIEGAGIERVKVPLVRRLAMPVLVVLAVGAISVAGWLATRSGPEPGVGVAAVEPSPTPVVIRPSVAVVALKNSSPDESLDWVGDAAAEMLTTELAAGGQIRIVERDQVSRVMRQLAVDEEDQIKALRRMLDVDTVVVGSFVPIGQMLQLNLRLVDAASGELRVAEKATGQLEQLFLLTERVGTKLRESLKLDELTAAQSLAVQASFPTGVNVNRLIFQGLQRLDREEVTGAIGLLEQAVELDQEHPLPHAVLAEAYRVSGHDERALEEVEKALEYGDVLPERRRLLLEGDRLRLKGENAEAAELFMKMWRDQADDVGLGLRVALALRTAGKSREALVVFDQLGALDAPLSDDPRIDLQRSETLFLMEDFDGALVLAQRVAERAAELGSEAMLGLSYGQQAGISFHQGKLDEAGDLYQKARAVFEGLGDRRTAAVMLEGLAAVVRAEGDLSAATHLLRQSLTVYRDVGDKLAEASALNLLGSIAYRQGDLDHADGLLTEAVAAFKEVGRKDLAAEAINNHAVNFHLKGELVQAETRYLEAMGLFNEAGQESSSASAMTNLAEISYLRGRLDEAENLHKEALVTYMTTGDSWSIAYENMRLGMVAAAKGDQFVAKDKLDKALEGFEEQGDPLAAAEVRVRLAETILASGDSELAAKTARRAEEVLRSEGAKDLQALALAVLARAILSGSDPGAATGPCEKAIRIASESGDRRVRFAVGSVQARLAVQLKPSQAASEVRRLEVLAEEAERASMVGFLLQLRLAAAELSVISDPAGATELLRDVVELASSSGHRLVADQARAALAANSS